jgi:hypothetical protein
MNFTREGVSSNLVRPSENGRLMFIIKCTVKNPAIPIKSGRWLPLPAAPPWPEVANLPTETTNQARVWSKR